MRRRLASAVAVVFASSLVLASPQLAAAGTSVGDFEIDGNLVDSPAGGPIDWATPPPTLINFTDASGNKDDSFNTGSKELEPGAWDCQTGSAPQKGDILNGQVAFRNLGGKQFVYVDYTRKSASGDAHIDYEFNQLSTVNPVCPALPMRKDGDIAVTFDTENGGATIMVRAFTWKFSSPGIGTFTETSNLVKGTTFDGAVNIPNSIPGHTAGDFGEAALNLSDTIGAFQCGQFASLHMNSRSSTAINSALQDRTATKPLPLPDCPKSALVKGVRNATQNPSGTTYSADATAKPGDTLVYRLRYTNTGTAPATNVTITDTIQPRQTFQSCTPTPCGTAPNLSWTFASIGVGATQDVYFTVKLDAVFPNGTTHVLNSAVADTDQEPPTQPSSTDVTVTAAPSLSSAKTVSPTSQDVGKSVTYSVKVTNSGSADGTTTVVDDYDQSHLTISGISNGGTDNGDKITWSNLAVPAGQTVTLTYTGTVKGTFSGGQGSCQAGQYPVLNSVTITGGTGSNATLCVNASPVLTTDKTVSPTSQDVGKSVTYTVKVSNTGTADATTTVVDDYDQSHITVSNISNGGVASNPADKITWSNLSVPAGQTVTLTYTGTVKGTFTGSSGTGGCTVGQYPVLNSVTITGGTGDTATLCVNAAPVITSSKSVSPTTAGVGDAVTYTITVRNTGAASGVTTVVDDYDQAHIAVSNAQPAPTTDDGDKLTWSNVTVLAGDTKTFTYTGTVIGTFDGGAGTSGCGPGQYPVLNSVTVTGGTGSSATLCVNAAPIIVSAKSVSPTSTGVGGVVTYTITVSNTGTASGVTTVVDDYDQNHITVSNVQPAPTSDDGSKLTWADVTVLAGETKTFTYTGTVKGTFSGPSGQGGCATGQYPVLNLVTVTGGTGSSATLCVNAQAVLTPTKVANKTTAEPGDVVQYTITVTNSGAADGTTDVVDDYDQAHLVVDDATITPSSGTDNGDTITWTNVTVPAGESRTFTYSGQVTGPFGPAPEGCSPGFYPVLNSVTVTGASTSSTVCVNTQTTLAVAKTACPTVAVPGGLLTYTITYSNTGANPATNAIVTDTVPAGTSVVSTDGGTASDGKVTWNVGTVPVGGSGTKTLVVLVGAANGEQLVNLVTAKADNAVEVSNGTGLTTNVSNAGATTHGRSWALDVDALGVALVDEASPAETTSTGAPTADAASPLPLPIGMAGVATVSLLASTSTSSVMDRSVTTATSEVANVDLLGGAIVADAVKGVSQSVAGPFSASANSNGSELVNLAINGTTITNVTPNTKLTVKNPLIPTQKLATVVLLEETKSAAPAGSSFTAGHQVNMIHVTLLQPFLTLPKGAEIIVAHAESTATYPSGLACGTSASTVGANAFTAYANGLLGGEQVVEAQVGDARITPLGGSDSDDVAAVLVPDAALAATGANTASGAISPNPTATSRARVQGANVLDGLITADVLDVAATSNANGSSAATTFATTFLNLRVAGTPVDVPVDPNTTLIELMPGTGDIVLIVLNEQIASSDGTKNTSGTVNAIHAWVLNDSGVVEAEVIVASASSEAHK